MFRFDTHAAFLHVPEKDIVVCEPPPEWVAERAAAGEASENMVWIVKRTLSRGMIWEAYSVKLDGEPVLHLKLKTYARPGVLLEEREEHQELRHPVGCCLVARVPADLLAHDLRDLLGLQSVAPREEVR